MQYRRHLGNTGISVSPIGLGTVKWGRTQSLKYPTSFQIPDDAAVQSLLKLAQNLNINLIDTAPAYGQSEERLGTLLSAQHNRKDWIIATKVGEEFDNGVSQYNFTPEHVRFSIERSLKRLKTDYLDIVLVHSDGNDVYNIEHFGLFEVLAELKTQGFIRAFGMSSKTVEGGLLTLSKADLAMVAYNPIYTEEQAVLRFAEKHQKGILIKKALASGHVQTLPGTDPVKTAFEFIFKEAGVTAVILGTINPSHLSQAVSCVPSD